MSEILKEVTEWKCDFQVANNTYLLDNKGKIIAYAKSSNDEIITLSKPIGLDKRYRKFIKVNHIGLSKILSKVTDNNRIFKVKSKDKEYTVTLDNDTQLLSCTCTGYTFRGKCKHIDAVNNTL